MTKQGYEAVVNYMLGRVVRGKMESMKYDCGNHTIIVEMGSSGCVCYLEIDSHVLRVYSMSVFEAFV